MVVTRRAVAGIATEWVADPDEFPATSCNEFTAAAAADGNFWFVDGTGGCLLEIDAGRRCP